MPVSPPTYGVAYSQAECNANATTICGFVDTANTNTAADVADMVAIKAALLTWVTLIQQWLEEGTSEASTTPRSQLATKLGFEAVVTALT